MSAPYTRESKTPNVNWKADAFRACVGQRLIQGLFSRGVISRPGVNLDGRQSLGREQLHFDLPPAAVVARILWFISEDVLVAQLHSNFGSDIRQIGQLRDREDAATGHFYEF